jgi:hypothetical protein
MATLVTPTNTQKIEFDVTTTEGPSRVTIVTGAMPIDIKAFTRRLSRRSSTLRLWRRLPSPQ